MLEIDAVKAFLAPRSVAIIGVSARDDARFRAGGRAVLDHLVGYGYEGEVWPIHPTAATIGTTPTYPSLAALPGVPDCVVVALPATAVLGVLEACAAIGARQVLVLTGGFSELGPEGSALEAELKAFAADHAIHIAGPNSTGLVNVGGKLAMSMTSVLTAGSPLRHGSLAIIAQSGAIASSIVERARDAGIGISHLVSIGNQLDLGAADFLGAFAEDPEVHAVAMYLESVHDGPALAEAMARMHRAGKRVVALLGGHSPGGEQAAASHTGKVLGRGALELSLLRALDITIAEDLDDLWLLGHLFAGSERIDPVDTWAVMTFSGGMGVLTVDQMAKDDAALARFSDKTAAALAEHLPAYVKPSNPLDIGPGAMPEHFEALLRIVAEDEHVGGVCLPIPMGTNGWHGPIVDGVLSVAAETTKPILVSWYGGIAVREHMNTLRARGVVTVDSPTALGRMIRALSARGGDSSPELAPGASTRAVVGGFAALEALEGTGVDVARMRFAATADAVAPAAAEVGYPVVVKSANPGVAHRLELGLVRMGITDEDALRRAVAEMETAFRGTGSTEALTFVVQTMVTDGVEVVLAVRDAGDLGWFGGIGLGGSAIEVFHDVAYVPLPTSGAGVQAGVRQLHSRALWSEHRGRGALDVDWVAATLNRLAELAATRGWQEIECNPALVDDQGGRVVDALAVEAGRSA